MAKDLQFGAEARQQILAGVEILAKAVGATLGPKGRNAVLERPHLSPRITKDGVTVAREIILKDPFQNLGAQMIKEVASRTNDLAGDGTTTSTVLAAAIFREGVKAVAAGMNPMDLKRGIDKAVETVVKEIKKLSKNIKTKEEIAQIGTISANGDKDIGARLADAMDKVGKEGVISIEEGRNTEFEMEIVDGMQFDNGYISPFFVTNQMKMSAELENPYILIVDDKIGGIQQIFPLLESIAAQNRSLLIIAEEVEVDVLSTIIMNKHRGAMRVAAVRSPGFGESRKEQLQDIAILTGGDVVSEEMGGQLEQVTLENLGNAKRVIITKDNTTIIDGAGKSSSIKNRCEEIRQQIKKAKISFDTKRHGQRLAKLLGGVAIVRVGGTTEFEMKEKRDRVDDALHATKAAMEEGIVPGGGAALAYASLGLVNLKGDNEDQQAGINIVKRAILMPMRIISDNAGVNGEATADNLLKFYTKTKDRTVTYNAQTDEYVDAFKMGIIDPTKVVRIAIEDAASVSGLLITTETLIVEKVEEKKN